MDSISLYRPTVNEKKKFLAKTYMWMGVALLISAAAALFTASSEDMVRFLFGAGAKGFLIVALAEIALVFVLSMAIRTISVFMASLMFIAYSVLNGITLSSIFFVYSLGSIAMCFFAAAAMFIFMSIYAMITKQDLSKAGHYLMMGVLGIIIASVVDMLLRSDSLNWLISIVTVVLFTGLTAYDTQKILRTAQRADSSDAYRKISIIGALELYLDFINIFLSLLRLFGKRK